MKQIKYIFIGVIVVLLAFLFMPKSCEPSGKFEQMEAKSNRSLIIDSLQTIETARIRTLNDSLISELKTRDSLHKEKIETLSGKYYALRSVVKKLQLVRVDSSGQTVNVPADQYNASINSGTMCDSLLMYLDSELAVKDSIISTREIQLTACGKESETKGKALSDLIELNAEEKKQGGKARDLNKKIPTIAIISGLIGSVLTLILLK